MPREKLDAFVTMPGAWKDAPHGLDTLIRLERNTDRTNPDELVFFPDRVVADFRQVDMSQFDVSKALNDCLLVAVAIQRSPEKISRMLRSTREATSWREIDEAYHLMKELYVTEEGAVRCGGGMLWLVAAVMLLAGCEHCHASHVAHP